MSALPAPVSYTHLDVYKRQNLKRMMGYSSIAQAGFILPLFIGTVDGRLAPNAPF